MKILRLALPIAAGLLLLAGTLAGLAQAAGGAYREVDLAGALEPEEIHLGADGNVWISDYDAGQVWQVNPATGAFKRYGGLPGAVDARPGPGGYVWWLGIHDGWIGRLELATGQVTTWTTNYSSIWGLAFDEQGRLWLGEYSDDLLLRFEPASHQLCEVDVSNGLNGYMHADEGVIWYGSDNAGLGRIDTATNENAFWSFGSPGLGAWSVRAEEAGVWFVDDSEPVMGRLDPDLNTLTTYTSSLLIHGAMVQPRGQNIWFTDRAGMVVALDPALAASATRPVTKTTETLTPAFCVNAGAGTTYSATLSTGVLAFTGGTFPTTVENGMTHYILPDGAYPYGLADVGGDLWFVDLDRQTLTILEAYRLRLPLVTR